MVTGLRTLLIVDDEPDLREILKEMAKQQNIPCYEAENGEEGYEILRRTPITAVCTDITMPVMNGMEFLRKVRSAGLFTPFVFITAHDNKDNLNDALKIGAFDFLSKPFDPIKVEEVLFRALDVGSSIQELLDIGDGYPDGAKKVEQAKKLLAKISRYGLMK
jgi:DNA-binding NtrC family response regulator